MNCSALVRNRAGSSLIESLVAVTMISIGMLGLAPLMLNVARANVTVALDAQRSAAVSRYVARYQTVPFATLVPGRSSCASSSETSFPHTMCAAVTQPDTTRPVYRITIIVTYTGPFRVKADTVAVDRSAALTTGSNPFGAP